MKLLGRHLTVSVRSEAAAAAAKPGVTDKQRLPPPPTPRSTPWDGRHDGRRHDGHARRHVRRHGPAAAGAGMGGMAGGDEGGERTRRTSTCPRRPTNGKPRVVVSDAGDLTLTFPKLSRPPRRRTRRRRARSRARASEVLEEWAATRRRGEVGRTGRCGFRDTCMRKATQLTHTTTVRAQCTPVRSSSLLDGSLQRRIV